MWVLRLSARCVSQRSEDGLLGVTHDHDRDVFAVWPWWRVASSRGTTVTTTHVSVTCHAHRTCVFGLASAAVERMFDAVH